MKRLLMISGDRTLAQGHRGAFYNTLQHLHTQWDQIDIITPTVGKHISQMFFGNVSVHASPWPLLLQPLFILQKGVQLYRKNSFDIMTVHEYPPFYNGIGAWLLARKINVPYVLEVMHFPGIPKAGNVKELFYHWLMRIFFRFEVPAARRVRVINRQQTPEYLLKSGVPESKLLYIPAFYIDLETFKPQSLEKKQDVLFVGRLVANKGIFVFLDAVRKNPHLRARIVGDGPAKSKIESYLIQHQLKGRVIVHGWAANAQEVATLMNESKLLVMTSYNEGGPRVVLEAMASGLPVLATPVGIVLDVIKDRESGRIISWNSSHVVEVIKETLSNEAQYDQMRSRGLEIVKQFEKNRSIEAYAKGIQQLIT